MRAFDGDIGMVFLELSQQIIHESFHVVRFLIPNRQFHRFRHRRGFRRRWFLCRFRRGSRLRRRSRFGRYRSFRRRRRGCRFLPASGQNHAENQYQGDH